MKTQHLSYLLFFIFTIGLFTSCKKNGDYHSIEKDEFKYAEQLNAKLEKLNSFIAENKSDSLKAFLPEFNTLAGESQNDFYLGKACSFKGYLHLNNREDDSAFYYLNLAKGHYTEINDSLNIAKSLTNMAIIQSNLGDYSGSELTATEALGFLENQSDRSFISSVYNCLAISSFSQGNYDEAIYWYELALDSTTDSYSRQLYKNNLAVAYLHKGNYAVAVSELIELKNQKKLKENPKLLSKIIDNLGYAQWKQNPSLNTEPELQKALEIRKTEDDKWGMIASHSHLSEFFTEKSTEKLLFHAGKMYEYASLLKSPDDRLEALQKLILAENPDKAKEYAIVYAKLNDSLNSVRNLARDRFAKIRYDSETNRKENEVLRAETAEQNLEIERRKLYATILISLIILAIISALGFFRIQKIKNQKRLNEEIYATEVKISRKVHDELSNNVYQLMSFLEVHQANLSAEKKNLIMDKLEDIYKLSRDISYEIRPIETGKNYPEELTHMISSFQDTDRTIILIGFQEFKWHKLTEETKIQFQKILQELLTNMKKHSKANRIMLSFKSDKNKFHFIYSDDGIGWTDNEDIKKNGLLITETRIEKLKGEISFAAEPGKGVKVNITIPI